MQKKLLLFYTAITANVDRLYPRRYYTATIFFLIVASIILSTLFIFSLPAPLRPKTSIGLINGLAILGFVLALIVRRHSFSLFSRPFWKPFTYVVVFYFLSVLASVLAVPTIYDSTPLRLLFSGVLLFWLTGELRPTEKRKRVLIHGIGITAVGIACLSLLQVAFPFVLNAFAEKYLLGRAAYGIAIEFNRGRLLPWGALIFIFPFFYSSSLLISWRSRIWRSLYVLVGYASILGAIALANFRWTFLVFIGCSFAYGVQALRLSILSVRQVKFIGGIFIVSVLLGLIIARMVLGYNLLDRFLLRDAHRDIEETAGRITLYNQALTAFQAYPLFGTGYGNYYSVVWPFPHMQYFSIFDQFNALPIPIASHNEFYTVMAETGIFGLCFFLFLLYIPAKHIFLCLRSHSMSRLDTLFVLAAGTSWVTIFSYIWFENMYPQNIVYILLMGGLLINWIHLPRTYGQDKP